MILLASFWQHPAVIGIAVGIPSAILGYLGYRRAVRVDRVAEQAGIASTHSTAIGQVVGGLNSLVEKLQHDNDDLRGEVGRVRALVEAIQLRLDLVETGGIDLVAKNAELERQNRLCHAENEELKVEIGKLKKRIATLEKNNSKKETP